MEAYSRRCKGVIDLLTPPESETDPDANSIPM